jgi:hypothetical protein
MGARTVSADGSPVWTGEPPAVAGWWWLRETPHSPMRPIHILEIDVGPSGLMWKLMYPSGEFAGPIPTPVSADGTGEAV